MSACNGQPTKKERIMPEQTNAAVSTQIMDNTDHSYWYDESDMWADVLDEPESSNADKSDNYTAWDKS